MDLVSIEVTIYLKSGTFAILYMVFQKDYLPTFYFLERKGIMRTFFMFCSTLTISIFFSTVLYGAHGISIDGKLKYPQNFERFEYVSKEAKKGGDLFLWDFGSFDKMNPFTLKGLPPLGIGMFVYETLAISSLDEPFAKYGLLAKDIEVAEDKLSVVFTLDEEARFSDNSQVTAEDVQFSLEIIKSDKVHPRFPFYYQDIIDSEIIDDKRIRFRFAKVNRELPLITSDLPVFSKKFYEKYPFGEKDTLVNPVGSGPYIVESMKLGKSITYRRNPDYWANNKPVRKGMYNFDKITVQYYKDQVVAVEAFKAGEFDFMLVNVAKQWARDMTGAKFENGSIEKKLFPHNNNAGMQGFVFNTRKKLFKDVRVRKALGLAFDFEWTNQALFFNQYTRSHSFFSNSYLAASGLPQGLELEYLLPFKDSLPSEVFSQPLTPPVNSQRGSLRANLREAKKLLREAGWNIENGKLKNKEGEVFSFEMILVSPFFERVIAPFAQNLKKLGIHVDYRKVDPALYTDRLQKFDFDMIVYVYGQSQSPGNEQRNYWHSQSAETVGSKNFAGIKSPVIDSFVDKIIYASTQEELTAACKALDRVLWYGYYVLPNWFMNGHRLVYYNKFSMPNNLPIYYDHYSLLMTWWQKQSQTAQ